MKQLSVVVFLVLATGQNVKAADLPGYDFHYAVSGDSAIAPAQVFDDGHHLYLQFKDQTQVPALFIKTVNGVTRLSVHPEFPYLVTDRLAPEIMLKFGNQQAIVHYTGGRALSDGSRADGAAHLVASNRPVSDPAGMIFHHDGSQGGGVFHGELIFRRNGESGALAPAVASPYVPSAQRKEVEPAQNVVQKTAYIPYVDGVSENHAVQKSAVGSHQTVISNKESLSDAPPLPRQSLKISMHLSRMDRVAGGGTYTVRAGDSLWRIAHRTGVTVSALAACNHLQRINWLQVGQVLQVPGSGFKRARIGWQTVSWQDMNHSKRGVETN